MIEKKAIHAKSALNTRNTQLAAALNAMGVRMARPYWSKLIIDGNERVVWHFEHKSTDGKYDTRELIDHWYDDNWFQEHFPRRHPFALLICALSTKEYLVDQIKKSSGHEVFNKNGKKYVVSEGTEMHKRLKQG